MKMYYMNMKKMQYMTKMVMKRFVATLIVFFLCCESCLAQEESVKPTFGVSFDRPVAVAIIDGETHQNVIVEIDAADIGDQVKGVKIVIRDSVTRKKILRKRFDKSYLYAFSDGTITIGKGNALTQMILYKHEESLVTEWRLILREKGLY